MLADAHSPFDHAFAAQHGADVAVTVDTSVATAAAVRGRRPVTGVTAVAGPFPPTTASPPRSPSPASAARSTASARPRRPVLAGRPGRRPHPAAGPLADERQPDRASPRTRNGPGQLGSTVTDRQPGADRRRHRELGHQHRRRLGAARRADRHRRPRRDRHEAQLLYRFASQRDQPATSPPTRAPSRPRCRAARSSARRLLPRRAPVRAVQRGAVGAVHHRVRRDRAGHLGADRRQRGQRRGHRGHHADRRAQVHRLHPAARSSPATCCSSRCPRSPARSSAWSAATCSPRRIYAQNAQVYQVGVLGVPFWVDVAVPLTVLVLTVAAAVGPASRAGAMSAVQAIATGRAPRPRHGFFAQRALAKLTGVPRPVTLGFAAPAARPGRTLVTVVAVLFGAAAVTFGVGLATSLNRVYDDIYSGTRLPVRVSALPPGATANPGGPAGPARAAARSTVAVSRPRRGAADRGAAARHHHGDRRPAGHAALPDADERQPGVPRPGRRQRRRPDHRLRRRRPGLVQPGADLGHAGTRSPGVPEIDVNTLFLTDTGTQVGDTYTMVNGGHKVTAKIVGEVFAPGNDVRRVHVAGHARRARPDGHAAPASTRSRSSRASTPTPTRAACSARSATRTSSARQQRRRQGADRDHDPGRHAHPADHRRRRPRRAEHGRPADPRARPRHRHLQGPGHDPAADPDHGGLLGRPHRPGRGHHRGPGRHPAAPQRAPGDGPRGQLRPPGVGHLGVTRSRR